MILTSSTYGLLFSLNLPDGLATAPFDIGLYKAFARPDLLFSFPMFAFPPQDAVAALIILQKCFARTLDYRHCQRWWMGIFYPPRGTFHVCMSQEFVDLSKREVSWRMSKKLVAKMRHEKW